MAMKASLFLFAVCVIGAAGSRVEINTITKIVKMLTGMLDKSKEDAESDKEAYGNFKCYCDSNTEEKTKTIKDSTEQIGLLSNKIESLQGSTGELSVECAQLKADIASNEMAREQAESLRKKEHESFVAEETDLTTAIATMGEAIDVLAAVGGDQTLQNAEDNAKFMAGYEGESLLKLKTTVSKALVAARTFLPPAQRKQVESFMQAPFTGTYSSQSGAVVGILKDMKDTFESNLKSAQAAEKAQKESHDKFMKVKKDEYEKMTSSYEEKQGILGDNDGDLATKKDQLKEAKAAKADAEEFLETLTPMCEKKAKEYEQRKVYRANEEAALSKAIAILDSDAAQDKFRQVDATSTGGTSLLQFSLLRRSRRSSSKVASVSAIARQLRAASRVHGSKRLSHVASLILALGTTRAKNPFKAVLDEIEKMQELIKKEGKVDKEQYDWCKDERETNNEDLEEKKTAITNLKSDITSLEEAINDPETGLKKQISDTEEKLEENHQSQVDETKARQEENMVYQKAIANTAASRGTLEEAIAVLQTYYDEQAKKNEALAELQKRKEEPAPPDTWDKTYEGQSSQGNDVISQLEFVLTSTEKEEESLHTDEQGAQHDYEDSMASLKTEEEETQESLATLHETLAEKQKELVNAQEELEKTEGEKAAIENYLEKIKPGCDFIDENFDLRETNRADEKAALENAVDLLKATPAYLTAVANQKGEDQGKCKETCTENEAHVKCQACLAKVSEPGYCAGHAGTPGC